VAITRPTIEEKRRIDGKASRIYNEIGANRYMTPVEHVPTAAIPLGLLSKGACVL